VQQLVKENYLRWDSLGEFLALAASFEHLGDKTGNKRASVLAETLDRATATLLEENKSPARRLGQIDNRGSHAYLAMYWAQELAAQTVDPELAEQFGAVAKALTESETKIAQEMLDVQGSPADLGGYYSPDDAKAFPVRRPSTTLNAIIDRLRDL
jgi:isocitrate dehydrogenase